MDILDFLTIYSRNKAMGEKFMNLTIDKPKGWRPDSTGETKTGFGSAKVLSVDDKEGHTSVVVSVAMKKIHKWLLIEAEGE